MLEFWTLHTFELLNLCFLVHCMILTHLAQVVWCFSYVAYVYSQKFAVVGSISKS